MSPRVVRARRFGAVLAALAMSFTVSAPAMPAQAAPAYTLEERAVAITSPSLVYIEEIFTGYLRDRRTHTPVVAAPLTLSRRCSGFVVNADGYVAVPTSCVKPGDAAVRSGVLFEAAQALIAQHKLDRNDRDRYVTTNLPTTEFTGEEPGTQPQVQLYGQFNVATAGTTDAPAIGGEVVTTLDGSDVAIVKLSQGGLPAAELHAQEELDQGMALMAEGYATSDPDSRTGSFTLASKAVQVTGRGTIGKREFTKINGDVGRFSNGGMAVDPSSGRVVGMLNNDWTQPGAPVRAVTPSSAIAEALGKIPVANTLNETDQLFRSGLDAYFRGDYKTAITELGTVVKNAPTNRAAVAYRQQAEDRQKIEAQSSSGVPLWVWIAGAAVIGGLIAGLVTALVISSRRRHREATEMLVPVSLNPFAPISSMPFSAPPTSGGPTTYQGAAIPHPAPPGVPVPLPPSVYPAGGPAADAQPAGPQPVSPPPAAPAEPVAPPMVSEPATPPPPAQAGPPAFVWPDEEDGAGHPADDYRNTSNPWSPGNH